MLEDAEKVIGDVARSVGQSVVGIGRGASGVVIAAGKILTNAHVVRREQVRVRFADGRTETGAVVALDAESDLAVVAAETGETEPVEWAGVEPGIGSAVVALANPGGRGLRATLGFVSSTGGSFRPRGRRVRATLEHTAPLPRGSSGSPLLDTGGRLVGINTLRLEGGLIVAIAAGGPLRDQVNALARGEAPVRATLGLALAPPRATRRLRSAVGLPERDGLLVRGVAEDGPAAQAGIEQGDLVVGAAGVPIAEMDALYEQLDKAEPGTTLDLDLVRGMDERRVTVTLG